MKDTIVTNLVSKTLFVIVGFLSFIVAVLGVSFIVLQHGVDIQEASFGHMTMKKMHIQWDEKLNIAVEELYIKKQNNHNIQKHSKK